MELTAILFSIFNQVLSWIIHEPRLRTSFLARIAFPLRAVGTMEDKPATHGFHGREPLQVESRHLDSTSAYPASGGQAVQQLESAKSSQPLGYISPRSSNHNSHAESAGASAAEIKRPWFPQSRQAGRNPCHPCQNRLKSYRHFSWI